MNKVRLLYASTVGKKVIMALSGAVLFGFVFIHMAANLQMFAGPDRMNTYAQGLRDTPALLWAVRIVLIVAFVAHVATALQLQRIKTRGRGSAYRVRKDVQAGWGSRTMMWSGILLAVFVVVHLANLTWGNLHPNFVHGEVYINVITLFRQIPWAVFYGVVMIALGFHIVHGAWSMFQSLGANSSQHSPGLRRFARIITYLIVIGFLTVVVAVATRAIG